MFELKTEKWFTFPSNIHWVEIKLWKENDPKRPAWRYVHKEKCIYLFPEFLRLNPEAALIEKVLIHEFSHFLQKNYYALSDINIIKFLFKNNSWSFNKYSLSSRQEYISEYIGYWEAYILKNIELPPFIEWNERDDVIFKYLKSLNDFAFYKFKNK